jgi:hypothetical protein
MDKLKIKIFRDLNSYLTTAFGLIVGLAWNDAVKSLIDYWFPADENGLIAKFLYALILTLIVVIAGFYFSKFLSKREEENE